MEQFNQNGCGVYKQEVDIMEIRLVFLMVCANGLLLVINAFLISKWRQNKQQIKAYQNIELLNNDLRTQRHDFLNHLQVTYGLIELKEYEEASRYLNKIYGKINQLNNNIKTEKIAINALLQTKSNEAEHKGIRFSVDASSKLSEIDMEECDLCGCLSNLIDNAFEATSKVENDKCVWIRIFEDMNSYFFEVANTGESLNEKEITSIFKEGVTSKSQEGHGLGLFLVKKALKDYGDVWGASAEYGMIFTIKISKPQLRHESV